MIDITKMFAELDALEVAIQEQMDTAKKEYEKQVETLRRMKTRLGQTRAAIVPLQQPRNVVTLAPGDTDGAA